MERTCTLHCENNAWLHAISKKLDKILVLRRDSVCFLQLSSLMQMGRASFKSMPATRDNLFSNVKVRSSDLNTEAIVLSIYGFPKRTML
jgi:hypothetical protein